MRTVRLIKIDAYDFTGLIEIDGKDHDVIGDFSVTGSDHEYEVTIECLMVRDILDDGDDDFTEIDDSDYNFDELCDEIQEQGDATGDWYADQCASAYDHAKDLIGFRHHRKFGE